MPLTDTLRDDILAAVPSLRAFAISLCGNGDRADDLVQETLLRALAKLPSDQREALVLVGASGFSYEEAAGICGCAVGTIKSRVNRARTRLAELMAIASVDDFGPDRELKAVLGGGSGS